jgi:hypothetical protein
MSESLCKGILELDESIRFAAIANSQGTLVANKYRANLNPVMSKDETAQYAIQAVTRAAMREDFTSKLGPFQYSVGKYANLTRAVIPMDAVIPIDDPKEQTYLLLSLDVNSDVVRIIEKKIMKFLKDSLLGK